MGKKTSRQSGKPRKGTSSNTVWTGADHAVREAQKATKNTELQEKRKAILSHNTTEKKDRMKLKLHLSMVQRQVQQLKRRLEAWDPKEEAEKEVAKRKAEEQALSPEPPKKKGRKGPETWKLRGAARPAWEVYDFDVRYVDPHAKAHKDAAEKCKRSQNILAIFKGRLGGDDTPEAAREYLGLVMQLGHLSQESKQFKSARAAWLECIELEGMEPLTTARESLMRMYLDLKRDADALSLGQRLADDSSVWIRFSLALVSARLAEPESDQHMVQAIKLNPFCAYYIAYYDIFDGVMEYTDDLHDADDEPQSSLEEAIEYCTSKYGKAWKASDAAKRLRNLLADAGTAGSPLAASDVAWMDRLAKIEAEVERRELAKSDTNNQDEDGSSDDDDDEEEEEDESRVDVRMFAGMFRTAMEMVVASS